MRCTIVVTVDTDPDLPVAHAGIPAAVAESCIGLAARSIDQALTAIGVPAVIAVTEPTVEATVDDEIARRDTILRTLPSVSDA